MPSWLRSKGLTQIEKEIDSGTFEFSIQLEDIHMNIESVLTKRIGAAGSKIAHGAQP
ncbi:MAG: hypothetical protein R3F19_28395 [Verrucomicrobiales bacterium]